MIALYNNAVLSLSLCINFSIFDLGNKVENFGCKNLFSDAMLLIPQQEGVIVNAIKSSKFERHRHRGPHG